MRTWGVVALAIAAACQHTAPAPVATVTLPNATRVEAPKTPSRDPLPEGVLRRFGSLRDRAGDNVEELHYTAEGLLRSTDTVDFARTVVRDAGRGRVLLERKEHGVLSPTGDSWLSLGSPTVLWDLAKQKPRATLASKRSHRAAILRGGKTVVFPYEDSLWLWSTTSGEVRARVPYSGSLYALAGAAEGSAFAFVHGNRSTLTIIDGRGVARTHALDTSAAASIQLAFDGRGDFLAIARGERLWGIDVTGSHGIVKLAPIDYDNEWRRLAMSHDGALVAVCGGGFGDQVMLLDRRRDEWRHRWSLPGFVSALAFSRDGSELAVGQRTGLIRRFATGSGRQVRAPEGHDVTGAAALSPSGRRAITAGGRVYLWDASSGRLLAEAKASEGDAYSEVVAVVFASEQVALTLSRQGRMLRWTLPELRATELLAREHANQAPGDPGNLACAPQAGRCAGPLAWGDPAKHGVFDVTGTTLVSWPGKLAAVGLDPSGSVVAQIDHQGELVVREIDGDRIIARTTEERFNNASVRLALSPRGEVVALCINNVLTLWNPRQDRKQTLSDACASTVLIDDRRALAGDHKGQLRLVDAATAEVIGMARHQEREIVAISANAHGVLVGSEDGTALLYDPTPYLWSSLRR